MIFAHYGITDLEQHQDARFMDKVKPSKMDEGFFMECRQVVLALTTELGKAALPKISI